MCSGDSVLGAPGVLGPNLHLVSSGACRLLRVLDAAYAATPERFVRRAPTPPPIPVAAWINKPDSEVGVQGVSLG